MKKVLTSIVIIVTILFKALYAGEEIPEREKFLTDEVETAIEKGLEYLAKHQKKDGSFFKGNDDAGIHAICLLPFLANGHLPDLGKYGEVVRKGFDYLIDKCMDKVTGMIGKRGYEHYFCVLVLSQVFGEWKRDDLQDILEKATKLLVNAQNKNGGFGYSLAPIGDDETTAHCTAVEALRAAREAYMPVTEEVMKKAAKYTKACANKDGGFFYCMRSGRGLGGGLGGGGESGWVRTGLGVVALMAGGEYEDPKTKKGLDWLLKHKKPAADSVNIGGIWMSYGAYYVAMALYQAGGKYWTEAYPVLQKWLLNCKKRDGSFNCGGVSYGPMDTAFAVTALSFQKGLIPIFQR